MSWHFSRALVEEYSQDTSLDGEQSALSNTSHTQLLYSSSDRMMEFCRRSPSGMTCEHLTDAHGEAVLTWFLAGFPARTFPQQAEAEASRANVPASGKRWRESFARWDHASSTWKTPRSLPLAGLMSSSVTWPRWGSMRNGVCFRRRRPARGIYGKESGSWLPTIGKNEFKGAGRNGFVGSREYRGAKMSEGLRTCAEDPIYLTPSFAEYVMGWPIMWTELAPLETDKFQQWLSAHGKNYQQECEPSPFEGGGEE